LSPHRDLYTTGFSLTTMAPLLEQTSSSSGRVAKADICYPCRLLHTSSVTSEETESEPLKFDEVSAESYIDFLESASHGCMTCKLLVAAIDCLVPVELRQLGKIQIILSTRIAFRWIQNYAEEKNRLSGSGIIYETGRFSSFEIFQGTYLRVVFFFFFFFFLNLYTHYCRKYLLRACHM
jgi:hypothetical protein